MRICGECGKAHDDDKLFCTECGAVLQGAAEKVEAVEAIEVPEKVMEAEVFVPDAQAETVRTRSFPPPPVMRLAPMRGETIEEPAESRELRPALADGVAITAFSQRPRRGIYAPISTAGFFGIMLLMAVPVLNVIMLILWAFGCCGKVIKRSFARGVLLFALSCAAVALVYYMYGNAIIVAADTFLRSRGVYSGPPITDFIQGGTAGLAGIWSVFKIGE